MRSERGGVLLLFPVGLLVVVLLGAIAVDLGNVWLQQRRLADATDSAANDAVTYGLDQDRLRRHGDLALDPERVREAVLASVSGQDLPPEAGLPAVTIGTNADGNPTVTVTIESRAELIFGRITRNRGVAIEATGTAELTDGS